MGDMVSTLAGEGHDGQGYDEAGSTAGEHAIQIKEAGLNLGQAHDNEQGDDADADQLGVFADDREYHGGVVRDGAAVHGEADTVHHGNTALHR